MILNELPEDINIRHLFDIIKNINYDQLELDRFFLQLHKKTNINYFYRAKCIIIKQSFITVKQSRHAKTHNDLTNHNPIRIRQNLLFDLHNMVDDNDHQVERM
jgi:hypothetical protein